MLGSPIAPMELNLAEPNLHVISITQVRGWTTLLVAWLALEFVERQWRI